MVRVLIMNWTKTPVRRIKSQHIGGARRPGQETGMENTGWKRRHFLLGMGAVGVAGIAGGMADQRQRPRTVPKVAPALSSAALAGRRPNILMIVSDQERGWQDLPANLGLPAHEMLL